ncbi:hypothetical protein PYCC9005_003653 [Savitreella phatthalungensis]
MASRLSSDDPAQASAASGSGTTSSATRRPSGSRSVSTMTQTATASLQSIATIFTGSDTSRRASYVKSRNPQRSPLSIVTRAFVPHVTVSASEDANEIARKKGFASFYDLLRPYGQHVQSKVHLRDAQGHQNVVDDFAVNFVEYVPPPQQAAAQRPGLVSPPTTFVQGGDLVAVERQVEHEMDAAGENLEMVGSGGVGGQEGEDSRPSSSDYYYSMLDSMLSGLPTVPHETFSHPAAGCIAISASNPDPLETLVALYNAGKDSLPGWVDPGFLRYYVLIYDEAVHDLQASLGLFERMKRSFGDSCHMLRLSSKPLSPGEPTGDTKVVHPTQLRKSASERLSQRWRGSASRRVSDFMGAAQPNEDDDDTAISGVQPVAERHLSIVDHSSLITMVRDMVLQSLVPSMERRVLLWNDQVAGPRRGLANRFLKVGRSFWSSSRSSTPANGGGVGAGEYDPSTGAYPPNAAEAQLRKLADFAVMLRDWRLANGVYDMLRKDYSNDKAWRHHAGAQEMFVITLLLLPQPVTERQRVDVIEPALDSALYSYLSRSSLPFHALRATLLAAELLRHHPDAAKDDAAKWIMRAMEAKISGETTRALLVEHVARIFAASPNDDREFAPVTPRSRKFLFGERRRKAGFWRILAAEQWTSMGKLRLAREALMKAAPIYTSTERPADEVADGEEEMRPRSEDPYLNKAGVLARRSAATEHEYQGWKAIDGTLRLLASETRVSEAFLLTPAPSTTLRRSHSGLTPFGE